MQRESSTMRSEVMEKLRELRIQEQELDTRIQELMEPTPCPPQAYPEKLQQIDELEHQFGNVRRERRTLLEEFWSQCTL